MKLRQAQEFAARGHFAMRPHRKEAAPAAAGRDVAHEPPGPRRHQPQQQVGEVADDQLFARLLGQLIGPVQGLEEKVGQFRLIRHQIPAARLRPPHRVEQGVPYPPGMEEIHQLRQMPDVFFGHRGDEVQTRDNPPALPGP